MSRVYDREMKFLHCAGCGETRPLRSNSFQNPEAFVVRVLDPFLREHASCAKFKDVKRAAANLRWQRVLAAEKSGKASRRDRWNRRTGRR